MLERLPVFDAGTILKDGSGEDAYLIDHQIGEGGMAVVYLAQVLDQDKSDRPFVIKIPQRMRHVPNLYREGWWGRQDIPGIVRTLWADHTLVDDIHIPLLVQEFCGWGSLTNRFEAKSYTRLRAVTWIRQIAETMSRFPGVHRDLKPDNILFIDHQTPLVADFGFAVAPTKEESIQWGDRWDSAGGTPDFMAPEQIERMPLDHRTDQYALGLMLYLLVIQRLPFDEPHTFDGLLEAKTSGRLRWESSGIEPLNQTLMRACSRDPNDRFATYDAFIAALREVELYLREAVKR